MMRLVFALSASTAVALVGSIVVLATTDARLRSPDAVGILAVSLAIAWVFGLLLYAPGAWLLRRRGIHGPLLGALAVGLIANLPVFAALIILELIGGVFTDREALTVALLAFAIGVTHGFFAFRTPRPKPATDDDGTTATPATETPA
jgi:hypothetical protein